MASCSILRAPAICRITREPMTLSRQSMTWWSCARIRGDDQGRLISEVSSDERRRKVLGGIMPKLSFSDCGPKLPNADFPLLKVLLSYQLDQAIHRSAARQMSAISALQTIQVIDADLVSWNARGPQSMQQCGSALPPIADISPSQGARRDRSDAAVRPGERPRSAAVLRPRAAPGRRLPWMPRPSA
jgi:hypothetical protein